MYQNIIPAHCLSCGAIFQSRLISVSGNVTNLKLSGNIESCPYCGSMAKTAEGIFSITNNVLNIISSPEITKQMLHNFSSIVRNAYNDEIDVKTLIVEANKINPELGDLIKKEQSNLFFRSLLFMLIVILPSCSIDVNVSLDINQLIEQMTNTPPSKIVSKSLNNSTFEASKIDLKAFASLKSVDTAKKIGRNSLCSCGSGIKFKRCCGKRNP